MTTLYVVNFISALTASALSFVASALALKYGGVEIAQLNVVAIYFAMAFGGILTPLLSKWYKASNSLLGLEIFRCLILTIFPFLFQKYPITIPIFTFLISSISASFHSIKLSGIISGSSHNDDSLRKAIHSTSGMEGIVAIFSGIFAIISLEIINYKILAVIDALTYLALTIMLFPKVRDSSLGDNFKIFHGFSVIFRSKNLSFFTMSRILQNIPSSSISFLMPMFIPLMLGDVNKYAAGLVSFTSFQAISFGFFSRYISKNYRQNFVINFSSLATILNLIIVVTLLIIEVELGITSLIIVGILSGLSMAGFRMNGILIGTKITPKESMHVVISSGDTIVRISTAAYLSIFTFAMSLQHTSVLIFILLASLVCIFKVQMFLKNISNNH